MAGALALPRLGEVRRAWETSTAYDGPLAPNGLHRQASQPPSLSDSTNVVGFQLNVRPEPLLIPRRSIPGEPASSVSTHQDHQPIRASSIGTAQRECQKVFGRAEESGHKMSAGKSQWRLYGPSIQDSAYRQPYQPMARPYAHYTTSLQPVTIRSSTTYYPTLPTPSPAAALPSSIHQQISKPIAAPPR